MVPWRRRNGARWMRGMRKRGHVPGALPARIERKLTRNMEGSQTLRYKPAVLNSV